MMSLELFHKKNIVREDILAYEDKIKDICVGCGKKIQRKRFKNKYNYYWSFGNYCEKCIRVVSENVKNQKFEPERNAYLELLEKVGKNK